MITMLHESTEASFKPDRTTSNFCVGSFDISIAAAYRDSRWVTQEHMQQSNTYTELNFMLLVFKLTAFTQVSLSVHHMLITKYSVGIYLFLLSCTF